MSRRLLPILYAALALTSGPGIHWERSSRAAENGALAASAGAFTPRTLSRKWASASLRVTSLMLDDIPCWQEIIPGPDCNGQDFDGTHVGGNTSDTSGSQGLLWPSTFGVYGSLGGHAVVGVAVKNANPLVPGQYTAAVESGDGCTAIVMITLTAAEAMWVSMGLPVPGGFSNWKVVESDGCY